MTRRIGSKGRATMLDEFDDAAARRRVVSSRVPICPCPVGGFLRDMLGVARSSGLLNKLSPSLACCPRDFFDRRSRDADYLSRSIGSDCIDMNAFSNNPNLVVVDGNQASLIQLLEKQGT